MTDIKNVLSFIGMGVGIIVFINSSHSNLATKETVNRIEKYQLDDRREIKEHIKEIKSELKTISRKLNEGY